jgi:uncharacterized protein YjdB
MKYTQIPSTAFEQIQLNAGILVDGFVPATGVIGNLLGATSGGVNFTDTVNYVDFGEDIDNCPKNMMELKKIDNHEVKMTGTFVTISAATAKMLAGAADTDENDASHIIPRNDLLTTDFTDLWWIGDYSDQNTGDDAGFVAIHLMNALSTGGFQIQSSDKAKGTFAFEFTGHYSMTAQDVVPYEIYVREGGEVVEPSVLINKHAATVEQGKTITLTATTVPAGETVTWSTSASTYADVTSGGVVSGEAVGQAIITASITVDGVTYTDTCTVVVEAAPEP